MHRKARKNFLVKIRESREDRRSERLREVKSVHQWEPATRVADEDGRSSVGCVNESASVEFSRASETIVSKKIFPPKKNARSKERA